MIADSFGASLSISAAPPYPRATPAAPPATPTTRDSPITWPTILPLRQPSALSVPNSRTRRATAAIVSRMASPNAATRTATDSHLPRLSARLAALPTDPVTWLARLLASVTVADGSSLVSSCCTAGMSAALSAET